MIWKEIHDDQLFVYFNGELIYKKWLLSGNSVTICLHWSWWKHDRDRGDFMAQKETPPSLD